MKTQVFVFLLVSSALAFGQKPSTPTPPQCAAPQPCCCAVYTPSTPAPRKLRKASSVKKAAPEVKPAVEPLAPKAPEEPSAEAAANIQLKLAQARLLNVQADSESQNGPAQASLTRAQAGLVIAQTEGVPADQEVAKANAALLYAKADLEKARAETEIKTAPAQATLFQAQATFTFAQAKAVDSNRKWGPWLNIFDHLVDGASFVIGEKYNATRFSINQATGPVNANANGGNSSSSSSAQSTAQAKSTATQSQSQAQSQQQKQDQAQSQSQAQSQPQP